MVHLMNDRKSVKDRNSIYLRDWLFSCGKGRFVFVCNVEPISKGGQLGA